MKAQFPESGVVEDMATIFRHRSRRVEARGAVRADELLHRRRRPVLGPDGQHESEHARHLCVVVEGHCRRTRFSTGHQLTQPVPHQGESTSKPCPKGWSSAVVRGPAGALPLPRKVSRPGGYEAAQAYAFDDYASWRPHAPGPTRPFSRAHSRSWDARMRGGMVDELFRRYKECVPRTRLTTGWTTCTGTWCWRKCPTKCPIVWSIIIFLSLSPTKENR